MWTEAERVYVTRYDKRNAVLVRTDDAAGQLDFYMQPDDKADIRYCFSLRWSDVTTLTGETRADWNDFVGMPTLMRAYRQLLAPFAADDRNAYARQVEAADFFPNDALQYRLLPHELVCLDAVIERINLPERAEGDPADTATVLLRDRTGTMVAFVDEELFPELGVSYEEGQSVQAIGRVYIPADPEEGSPAYLDLLELRYR